MFSVPNRDTAESMDSSLGFRWPGRFALLTPLLLLTISYLPMKTKPYFFSLKALILNREGKCLLLRRSAASKHNARMWELPGGKLDAGEDPGAGLIREVQEETGMSVTLVRVAGSAESELPDRKVAYLIFEVAAESSTVALSSEHDACKWISPEQLVGDEICPQYLPFLERWAAETTGARQAGIIL